MRSSYPSSQSFFDCTSDSIRAEDVSKCRNSASFSSLSDLFTNPSCKSDLFPNSRAPVFVAEEVHFPEKKKRECEERTSIWHEWGSGECRSENVAEESSGFTSDLIRGGKSSIVSLSSFPNLGSANVNLSTEEFTFPARKKREGTSWREERTSWQDWSSVPPKRQEPTQTGNSPVVGSIQNMFSRKSSGKPFGVSSSKSSHFSSLGAPAKCSAEDVSFPARKKREERSFWKESCLDGSAQPDCEVVATPGVSAPNVSSLADMYMRIGSSNLFSKGAVNGTEEVTFPKRRNNADRNAWRDWTNTGYGDYDGCADQDCLCLDNSSQPTSSASTENDCLECVPKDLLRNEGSNRFSGFENSPACVLRSSVCESGRGAACPMQLSCGQVQAFDEVSDRNNDLVGNVDEPGCLKHQVKRTMGRGEAYDSTEDIVIDAQEGRRFPNSTSQQSRDPKTEGYPPPLRSRQAQSRVPNHMPWVQLQPIRSKGRFVLQEVKVTQPVVFQPIRSGGRLVLQLIGQEKKIEEDTGVRHHSNGLVAQNKVKRVPGKVGLNEPVMVNTEAKVAKEKTDVRQSLANRREGTEKRINSNICTVFAAIAGSERIKKTAKVWSIATPWEALTGEDILSARTDEPSAEKRDRTSFNFRELCYIPEDINPSSDRRAAERERTVPSEGSLNPDRSPPWLLGNISRHSRNYDRRNSLLSLRSQFQNAVDRLAGKGSVIAVSGGTDSAPLRLPIHSNGSQEHPACGMAYLGSLAHALTEEVV